MAPCPSPPRASPLRVGQPASLRSVAAALLLLGARGLALSRIVGTRAVGGAWRPAEASLRVSRSFASAFAGESGTASCGSLPFFRAHHGPHARFWQPREFAYDGDGAGAAAVQLAWFNSRERAYGDIFDHVLRLPASAGALVVDVGANTGWYSMFAAGRGHAVVAVDMQPECARRCRCASVMNRVTHLLALHTAYVSDDDAAPPLGTNSLHCMGGVNPAWRARFDWGGHVDTVQALRLGRELRRASAAAPGGAARVALIKVDIEGGEVAVLRSLVAGGALHLVDHLLLEFSPHMWAQYNVSAAAGVAAFAPLFAAGFLAVDVPENTAIHPPDWAAAPASGPAGWAPRGRIADTAALRRYTDALLHEVAAGTGAGVYTLWLFRA